MLQRLSYELHPNPLRRAAVLNVSVLVCSRPLVSANKLSVSSKGSLTFFCFLFLSPLFYLFFLVLLHSESVVLIKRPWSISIIAHLFCGSVHRIVNRPAWNRKTPRYSSPFNEMSSLSAVSERKSWAWWIFCRLLLGHGLSALKIIPACVCGSVLIYFASLFLHSYWCFFVLIPQEPWPHPPPPANRKSNIT